MYPKIVIPSLGRAATLKNRTLNLLKDIDKELIYIFVVKEEYEEYKLLLPNYNIIIGELGCLNQKRFISNYFPEDEILLFLDDDIKTFYKLNGSKLNIVSAETIILSSLEFFNKYNVDLLGIYPIPNPYFMRSRIRQGLSFCIGQYQLLRNKRDIFNKGIFKILEDYERSINYFIDYRMMRLDNFTLEADYGKLSGGYQSKSQIRTNVLKNKELKLFTEMYSTYCFIKKKKKGLDLVFKPLYSKEPKTVNMLWIDKGKNDIFYLSIRSWIYHGYQVYLYTNNMNMIDNPNVIHIDYKTILDIPVKDLLQFSDLFRYKLLYEKGGLYSDSDLVLINPYDFDKEDTIISSENTFQSGAYKSNDIKVPNIGLLKFNKGDAFLKKVIDSVMNNKADNNQLRNMKIFQKVLRSKTYSHYNKFVKEPIMFCSIPWWCAEELYKNMSVYTIKYNVVPPTRSMIFERSVAIHMWNNFSYNKEKVNKVFKQYETGSLYDKLVENFVLC